MSVSGVGGTSLSAHTASTEEQASVEKEGFLKLLVAQLGNQDPMAPQESDKYVDQLTNFSMLEQMMNLNKGVNNLSIGQLSNNSQDAVRFVGREVVAKGDSISFGQEGAEPVKTALMMLSQRPCRFTTSAAISCARRLSMHRRVRPSTCGMVGIMTAILSQKVIT